MVEGAPDWDVLVAGADLVVPSPGVRPGHPVMVAAHAARVPVRGDLDLAVEAAPVPVVAVTGTNGKSTVTSLVSAMLERSGRRAPAVGNIGRVVLDALAEPADVFVIEASSFQLHTVTPAFAPDGGDPAQPRRRPPRLARLVRRVRRRQARTSSPTNVPTRCSSRTGTTRSWCRPCATRRRGVAWFSIGPPAPGVAGWRGAVLVGEDGVDLFEIAGTWAPHDRANIAAAAVAARAMGARPDAMRAATGDFVRLHHRTEPVGQAGGVEFVDDSKATNPHATLAAIAGYPSVVLLAGGLSKGVDLSVLTTVRDRLRAVVAIGATPDEVESAFAGAVPTVRADSMRAAVRTAADLAVAGDVVLLSPACASFDWYDGYAARGDDFRREVETLLEEDARVSVALPTAVTARVGRARGWLTRHQPSKTPNSVLLVLRGRGAQRRGPGDGAVGVVGAVARLQGQPVVVLRASAPVDHVRRHRVRGRVAVRPSPLAAHRAVAARGRVRRS